MVKYDVASVIVSSVVSTALVFSTVAPGAVAFAAGAGGGDVAEVPAQAASVESGSALAPESEPEPESAPLETGQDGSGSTELAGSGAPVETSGDIDPGAADEPAESEGVPVQAEPVVSGADEPAEVDGRQPDGVDAPLERTAAQALSLVYVEEGAVDPGETVEAAFVLGAPASPIVSAVLEVMLPDGVPAWYEASALAGCGARFSLDTAGWEQGYAQFTRLSVACADGASFDVTLDGDDDMVYGVLVGDAPFALMTADVDEPAVQTSFYTVEGGELVGTASLESALANAAADIAARSVTSESGPIVIALDAGHDSSKHLGATGQGLSEDVLTLKIAQYAKAELETYPGVEVYMVRDTPDCPYPDAASESEELKLRVQGAVEAGAQVYVSIHLNSFSSDTVSGAEVWYPNQSVNITVADVGKELSQSILDQLVSLGLGNRGVKENSAYGDEGLDYYSIIRNSKANGLAGIIVEHAFITSGDDYGLLSTEEGLKQLGIADAMGIAGYFGLTKDGSGEVRVAVTGNLVLEQVDRLNGTVDFAGVNVSCTRGVKRVSLGIAPVEEGASFSWYAMDDQGDGSWSTRVPLAGLGADSGLVDIEGVVTDVDGVNHVFCLTRVSMATSSSVTASYSEEDAALLLTGKGDDVAAARNVSFQVSGATGGKWYQGVRQADGAWTAAVPRGDFGTGDVTVALWATSPEGGTGKLASATAQIPEPVELAGSVSVGSYDAAGGTFRVVASGVSSPTGVRGVSFAVTGQGTTRWYAAARQDDGTWAADVPASDFDWWSGSYAVQGWLNDASWTASRFGTGSGTVSVSLDATVTARYVDASATLEVRAEGEVIAAAKNVAFAVTGADGTRWYQAYRQDDGSWTASILRSNLGGGTAKVALWATPATGATRQFGQTEQVIPAEADLASGTVQVQLSDDASAFVFKASKGSFAYAWNVAFCLRDTKGGPSTWIGATRDAEGAWIVSVDRLELGEGDWSVEGWACVGGETASPLGGATFSSHLHPIMAQDVSVTVEQLAAAYNMSGATYPADVYATRGAATIEEFSAIVIEEAVREGVDPAIVFAQAMLETGYLRFGGDVKAEQCNFCGLGATGNGAEGQSFSSVRVGIRAQVQHLKAYACTDDLVQECVDPRFGFVSRGCAPYVENLGGRWAVSMSYGFSVARIVDVL